MMMESAQMIGLWILVVVMLIPAVRTLLEWAGRRPLREVYPQPLRVQAADASQTQTECKKVQAAFSAQIQDKDLRHTQRTESLRLEIKADIGEVRRDLAAMAESFDKENERRIGGVHRRLDTIVASVNRMAGALKMPGGLNGPSDN